MRAFSCVLVLALVCGPLTARAAWVRDASGQCKHQWSSDDLTRGPVAILNAPLAPVRSAMGAVRWVREDDKSPRTPTARFLMVPVLGLFGAGAGLIDTMAWFITGLGDTLTGGAFAIAPEEATRLSMEPLVPFFAPTLVAESQKALAPCGGD